MHGISRAMRLCVPNRVVPLSYDGVEVADAMVISRRALK